MTHEILLPARRRAQKHVHVHTPVISFLVSVPVLSEHNTVIDAASSEAPKLCGTKQQHMSRSSQSQALASAPDRTE
jgi:hypothetical protein